MTARPCPTGDGCILVLGHDGDCRYTSDAEDESPLFDRIRPDSDEKTRADGWRYRIRREAGEMTVVLSEEQVLPEKVGNIDANRIRDRSTVIVGGQDVAWFRDTLDELLGGDSLRAQADAANRIVRDDYNEMKALRGLLAEAGRFLRGEFELVRLAGRTPPFLRDLVEKIERVTLPWAYCDEPPCGDGLPACGWTGEMSALRRDDAGVTTCPACGSCAIHENQATPHRKENAARG